MQNEVILTLVIGVIIMLLGFIVFKKQALFLVNFNSWFQFSGDEKQLAKVIGTIIIAIGVMVVLLPLILGTDSINPL